MRLGIVQLDGTWRVITASAGDWSAQDAEYPTAPEAIHAMLAAAEGLEVSARGARVRLSFLEGEQTQDKRIIEVGATNFDRPFPLPMMRMIEEPITGGHAGAVLVGTLEEGVRVGANQVDLTGYFYAGEGEVGATAAEAEQLVRDGQLTWWSPDFGDFEVETEVLEVDEDGWPTDWLDRFTSCCLIGATLCPKQALDSARVELISEPAVDEGAPVDEPTETETEEAVVIPITAAASRRVHADRFRNPGLPGPTPVTIEDNGEVYFHIAQWGVCHTGIQDRCVLAPHSLSDYAYFLTGSVLTDQGTTRIGQLTMGCGHADLTLAHRPAADHYDGGPNAVQWANVATGEDEHGIWGHGVLKPDIDADQVEQARALALSGDWRRIGGALELIAALSVPVPGFPVVSMAAGGTLVLEAPKTRLRTVNGECLALVAAGVVNPGHSRSNGLESRVRAVELALRREQLLRRVPAKSTLAL